MSFTDGKPRIATKEDIKPGWPGGFKCRLCGHEFEVGDYWRWVYANGTKGQRTGNFLVCKDCDGDDVLERAKAQLEIAERWFHD